MYDLKVETDLNLSHHQHNTALNKLIHASIKRKTNFTLGDNSPGILWPIEQFQLHRSRLYQKLNPNQQTEILLHCNDATMSDFYFLEKSGLAYCAKMILLGETTGIRQLYALIASDESIHLQWFTPYVPEDLRTHPQGKLLPVLGAIIEDCEPNTLYYLVQNIIEGWGVMTYKWMQASCQCPTLKTILQNILKDEAIHHQAGPALFNPKLITEDGSQFIYERMQALTGVLRVGPRTIVQCLERVVGGLNGAELEMLFEDMKTQASSQVFLNMMKALMRVPGMESYVQRLQDEGYFNPYSAGKAAKIYRE